MTTQNQITKELNKVEWQQVEYDADCSDVEGRSEMPRPVAPGHQNYPINSVINDLFISLELFQQLRQDGSLLPVNIVQINRVMQTFRRELNSLLEAASLRRTSAKLANDPVTERKHTEKLEVPSAVTVERKRSNGCSVSGNQSRKRKIRSKTLTFCASTSSRREGCTGNEPKEEPLRSSDSAYGSSPRNRPKSAEASIVKHKARHKEHKLEPTGLTVIEPTKRTKEMKKAIKKVRRIFQGMLDGTLAEDKYPQLTMMKKKVSELLEHDPDFSLMELVEEQLKQLY